MAGKTYKWQILTVLTLMSVVALTGIAIVGCGKGGGSSGGDGGGGSSATPTAFALTSPADGVTALLFTADRPFAWSTATGATSYNFEIATDDTFASPAVSVNVTTNSYTLPANTLSLSQWHYWRVGAKNAYGTTYSTGSLWSFFAFDGTTAPTAPGAFNLDQPQDNFSVGTQTPDLSWTNASNESLYVLHVDTSNTFANAGYYTANLRPGELSHTVTQTLLPNTRYYWKVEAKNTILTTPLVTLATPAMRSFITGPVASYDLTTNPTSISAGGTLIATLTAKNSTGATVTTATYQITMNVAAGVTYYTDAGFSITNTARTYNLVNGVATIYVRATSAGALVLSATDTVNRVKNSGSITVSIGTIIVTVTGANEVGVGTNSQFTAASADIYGNILTEGYTWSVTNGTGTATINGSGLLSGVTKGTVTVNALGGTSGQTGTKSVNIIPQPATVVFVAQPQSAVAGATLAPITVLVKDATNAPIEGANVTIVSTDQIDVLGTATVATNASGIATFSAISMTGAGYSLTLKAIASPITSANSTAFDISHAPLTRYLFSIDQNPIINNMPGSGLLLAVDAYDNGIDDNYSTVVTMSSTLLFTDSVTYYTDDTYQTATSTYTLGDIGGGLALIFYKALHDGSSNTNTAILKANDTNSKSGQSELLTVLPWGSPFQLSFVQQPTDVLLGGEFTPPVEVIVLDAYYNPVLTATNTIVLATDSAGAELVGTTSVAADGSTGVARFNNINVNGFSQPGNKLTAAATGLIQATSNTFAIVGFGAPVKLGFLVQPGTTAAGVEFNPVIQVAVQDAAFNTVENALNQITLTVSNGAVLNSYNVLNAIDGIAAFDFLTIGGTAGGDYILTATAAGLNSADSETFTIAAGAPAKLAFVIQPSDTTVDSGFTTSVEIAVQDAFGNTIPGATNEILMTMEVGTLGGTSNVNAVNGIATFADLTAGGFATTGYKLRASSPGLGQVDSDAFALTGFGTATQLIFITQPSFVLSGQNFSPPVAVAIADTYGNIVETATAQVTLAIFPISASLNGFTAIPAVNGVAEFSTELTNMTVNGSGPDFVLTATSGSWTVESDPFEIQ